MELADLAPHLSAVVAAATAWGAMRQKVAALAAEVEKLRNRDGDILKGLGDLRVGLAKIETEMKVRLDSLDSRMARVEVVHGITPPETAK